MGSAGVGCSWGREGPGGLIAEALLVRCRRRELRRLWSACQRPEDCQPTARWLADQLLGGVE